MIASSPIQELSKLATLSTVPYFSAATQRLAIAESTARIASIEAALDRALALSSAEEENAGARRAVS